LDHFLAMAAGPKNRIMSSFSLQSSLFITYKMAVIWVCIEVFSAVLSFFRYDVLHGRVLFQKLSLQYSSIFSFCIIRMSTNVFEKALYWILSWWIFLHPHISLRCILILSSSLWICLQLAPFHLCFPTKILLKSQLSHACYMLLPSRHSWFMNPVVMHFFSLPLLLLYQI
jgi:hypothetical protein